MKLPKVVNDLIASFEKLPGIGNKTAQRLAFYMLRMPQRDLDVFGAAAGDLKRKTRLCSICHNLTDREVCEVCDDETREHNTVCVVEGFQDVIALEKTGNYKGLYHVLHGAISPLNNIGPEELFIDDLQERLKSGRISEIILATNTSLEGEATAMYITRLVRELKEQSDEKLNGLRVSRLGRGLPTGVELEYADFDTLSRALESRMSV